MDDRPTTTLLQCHAANCRFRQDGGACAFHSVEVGAGGACLQYEEQTPEKLREYLARRGLSPDDIETVMKEAGGNGID